MIWRWGEGRLRVLRVRPRGVQRLVPFQRRPPLVPTPRRSKKMVRRQQRHDAVAFRLCHSSHPVHHHPMG